MSQTQVKQLITEIQWTNQKATNELSEVENLTIRLILFIALGNFSGICLQMLLHFYLTKSLPIWPIWVVCKLKEALCRKTLGCHCVLYFGRYFVLKCFCLCALIYQTWDCFHRDFSSNATHLYVAERLLRWPIN